MKDLKNKTKAGLFWDLAGSFLKQISAFVISVILARLLTPEQFGIVAIAMVFVSITDVFVDIGFTDAIIQKSDINQSQYSSIFIFNLTVSIFFAVLLFAFSGVIGQFYNSQEVANVVKYLSVIPIIAAGGKVHSAILTRELKFKVLTYRTLLASLIGGSFGIIAAFWGMGVYSLVFQQVVAVLAGTLALWYGSIWRPSFKFSFKEIKGIINFSQFVFFDQLLRQVFNRINTLFVGKMFTPAVLGFYSRAESLNTMVADYTSNSLRKVMYPVLSSVQNEDERFKRIFYRTMNLSSSVSALLAGLLLFSSDFLIITLFGSKWAPTIPFFQILVFSTLTASPIGLIAKAVLSKGYSKTKFIMGLSQRLLLLLPILVGSFYGIYFFAIMVVFSKIIVVLVFTIYASIYLKLSFLKQWGLILHSLTPMLVWIIVVKLFNINYDLISSLCYFLVSMLYFKLIKHEILNLISETVFSLKKKVFSKSKV